MGELRSSDFATFVRDVHGHNPYPWQERLLREVLTKECWPDLIDLPTGSGKTSLIDIAVFALALATQDSLMTWTPRRIVLVVDRRVVVSQAAHHAEKIAAAIRTRESRTLDNVAAALSRLGDADNPLLTAELRGGMVTDNAWTGRPDQPAVLTSTVDQVGSRLLFRGYGVSKGMRSVHAGLLGADCLYLLDEVHLSQPFKQTLRAIQQLEIEGSMERLSPPIHIIEMSATPSNSGCNSDGCPVWVFKLEQADLDNPQAAGLVRVLGAEKPTTLRRVPVKSDASTADLMFAHACADTARKLAREHTHVRRVAVVVNRVSTARLVADLLAEETETILLTGRMRGLDRQRILDVNERRIANGRTRQDEDDDALFVVATQCIEAGADFDFDGLVTECAPLDSLKQRFGRLDRSGDLTASGTYTPAVVLVRSTDLSAKAADPVYGTALKATWEWLQEQGNIDFGIGGLPEVTDEDGIGDLLAPRLDAPVLMPTHLDLLSQTRPSPAVEPDISLFLHGPRPTEPDVNVVWRSDVTRGLLDAASVDGEARTTLCEIVAACPPAPVESLQVPVGAVRRWLEGRPETGVYDVELQDEPSGNDGTPATVPRPVLRWLGDNSEVIMPSALRPGDTIVVASTDGGLSRHSWDPTSVEPVPDLGLAAQVIQRGKAIIRLHPDLWADTLPKPPRPPGEGEDPVDVRRVVADWLDELAPITIRHELDEFTKIALEHLRNSLTGSTRGVAVIQLPLATPVGELKGAYWVIQARRPLTDGITGSFDPEASSFTAVEVPLTQHLEGVGDWAASLAHRCGIPSEVTADIQLAGRLHDVGKADPRFQLMAHRGDPVATACAEADLAKSDIPAQDRAAREEARRLAGYPRGYRHELLSLALMMSSAELAGRVHDWALVRHLVAAHHGWCRPLAPIVAEGEPVLASCTVDGIELETSSAHGLEHLNSGISDRFWALTRRYGWYGLAWLETILRLADHRRSEEEERV